MSKQKESNATELVAKLNKAYHAIECVSARIKQTDDESPEMRAILDRWSELDAAFERTLTALEKMGENVKFDEANGEYFVGDRIYRIKFTCVSEGCVEVEAKDEQDALRKARQMADYDEIDLIETSAKLENVTEAV